jgi:hypothetical protein
MFTTTPPFDPSCERYQKMLLALLWRLYPPFYAAHPRDFMDYIEIAELMSEFQHVHFHGKVARRFLVLKMAIGPVKMDLAMGGSTQEVGYLGDFLERNVAIIANDALQELTIRNRVIDWLDRNPMWTLATSLALVPLVARLVMQSK